MTLPSPQHFTDREEALAAYDTLWLPGAGQPVLNIEGISGNGKTTLIWYLLNHHPRPAERLHLHLGFDSQSVRTGDYDLLDVLALQLRRRLPNGALDGYQQLRNQALDQAAAIRATVVSVQIIQTAEANAVISQSPIDVSAEYRRRLGDLRRQMRRALAQALADAAAALHERQVALFVDTYELLHQAADVELRTWFEEYVIENLLASLPNLRIVLAGREDLPWRADRYRRNTLRAWTRPESDGFLASYGLRDPALAEAIFAHCAGHPLLTSFARDIWEQGQAAGRPLAPTELKRGIDQAAASQWLFALLLKRLPEKLSNALRAAALLRELSLDALNALLEDTPLTYDEYQQLLRFSFVQTPAGWLPRIHDLVRQTEEAWNLANEPERHRHLHTLALAYYKPRQSEDNVDALYHLLALDVEAFAAWDEAIYQRIFASDRRGQQALLEMARLPERWAALSAQQRAGWRLRRGQVNYYANLWQAALEEYDEALALFRSVGDRLGEANVLKAQGDVLYFLKQTQDALAKYDEALALFRSVGDRLGEANVLAALSRLWLDDDGQQAAAYLEQAAALRRQIDDRYSLGADLGNFGLALLSRGRWVEALQYLGQAGAIFAERAPHLVEQMQGALSYALQQIYAAFDVDPSEQQAQALHAAADRLQTQRLADLTAALRFLILTVQFEHKQWGNAVRSAQALLAADAGNAGAWAMLADARSRLDDAEGAAAAYEQAVVLTPDEARLRRNYADTLLTLHSFAAAAAQLEAAAVLEPDAPYLALHWAELARAQDDRTGAEQWASEALHRQPDWDEAQAILDWARQGSSI